MKKTVFIIFIIVLAGSLTSFYQKEMPTQEDLMENYMDEKLDVFWKEEWKKCYEGIKADAVAYVDSIIYTKVNFNISDSLKTPNKPSKPSRPYDTLILDTAKIKPIIRDTISN